MHTHKTTNLIIIAANTRVKVTAVEQLIFSYQYVLDNVNFLTRISDPM